LKKRIPLFNQWVGSMLRTIITLSHHPVRSVHFDEFKVKPQTIDRTLEPLVRAEARVRSKLEK